MVQTALLSAISHHKGSRLCRDLWFENFEIEFPLPVLMCQPHVYINYSMNIFISEPKTCISKSYLLTPWTRVLLEKLTGLQLVKKFPAFYGT